MLPGECLPFLYLPLQQPEQAGEEPLVPRVDDLRAVAGSFEGIGVLLQILANVDFQGRLRALPPQAPFRVIGVEASFGRLKEHVAGPGEPRHEIQAVEREPALLRPGERRAVCLNKLRVRSIPASRSRVRAPSTASTHSAGQLMLANSTSAGSASITHW